MKNKDINLQIRINADQLELLNEAFKHYITSSAEPITRSEFMRRQLMLQCLKILKIVEMKSDQVGN